MPLRLLDTLAYSSLWVALAAAALVVAASRSLGAAADPRGVGLAFCGTLVIYNVDRLRDLERDRATAPRRSAFVERHRGALAALIGASGLAAAALSIVAGSRIIALLLPALVAGLAHRRLKHFALAKPLYLVVAWLLVVVGVPACLAPEPHAVGWTAAVLGAAILANAVACNVRDPELGARALSTARLSAALGVAGAALAPAAVRPLAAVPGVTLLALLPFRATERYRLLAVDGALLAGALLALPLG